MREVIRVELLEKEYVKKVHFDDGSIGVWKAPRKESDFNTKLKEQFNEIFCAKVLDEYVDSCLRPELFDLDQEFGILTTFIEEEWSNTTDNSVLSNSSKLPSFFVFDIFFHQKDKGLGAERHLRIKIMPDGSRCLCAIDHGFSLMGISQTELEPRMDLTPEYFDNLLTAGFINTWSDVESALYVIDSIGIERIVMDTARHIVSTCNLTSETRQIIFKYAYELVDYLHERRKLLRPALEEWWSAKKGNIEKQEVPLNAVP